MNTRSTLQRLYHLRLLRLCVFVLLLGPVLVAAQAAATDPDAVPGEVAWVLDYSVPANQCQKPRIRKTNEVAGKSARTKRQINRYAKCVKGYQGQLLEDHQRILEAVKVGINQEQSTVFVAKLRAIQAAIESSGADVVVAQDELEISKQVRMGSRPSL